MEENQKERKLQLKKKKEKEKNGKKEGGNGCEEETLCIIEIETANT